MQRDRELDNAKSCTEVTAGIRHGIDCLAAQFIRKLAELVGGEVF
jgi:hypothetical protein